MLRGREGRLDMLPKLFEVEAQSGALKASAVPASGLPG